MLWVKCQRWNSDYAFQVTTVSKRIKELFPDDSEDINRLCLGPEGVPFGLHHPDFFVTALKIALPPEALEQVRTGYVLLAGYYFLLDAIVDGHLSDPVDTLYLSHLLSGATAEFSTVCSSLAPQAISTLHTLICEYLAENSKALRDERGFRAEPLTIAEQEEFESIVGRSNAVLLLYAILSLVTRTRMDERLIGLVKELTYYIQLADDLGDWREDYGAARYTSLLRRCFHRREALLSEAALETELLLGGVFEERAATIVNGLDSLANDITQLGYPMPFLRTYVAQQRERVYEVLKDRLHVKLRSSAPGTAGTDLPGHIK